VGGVVGRPVSYQLLIEVTQPVHCAIGRLGAFDFPAGLYTYKGYPFSSSNP
jgi:hypothetical protein